MPPAKTSATQPPDGVDFIDEDDARGMFLPLLEEIPDSRRSNSHEHFYKIRAADAEERDTGLAGNRLRQQGFARSGRPYNEDSFRNPSSKLLKLSGVLEKIDDLRHFFFGFVDAGDIRKRNLLTLFSQHPSATLPERERLVAADLHLPHQKEPEAQE